MGKISNLKKKEDMYKYVAKPNEGIAVNIPTAAGVYYDFENKVAVATDGYILRISRSAYDPAHEKPEEKGVSIDREGNVIEGRYVNYRSVIPDFGKKVIIRPIDKEEIKRSVKQAREKARQEGMKYSILYVKVNGIWVKEKYLKMAMAVIDESIHPENVMQNKYFYGEKNGEEVLVSWHPGFNVDDRFVFLKKNGEFVFSC